MKIVFLDAYTNNPGDIDFGPLTLLGDIHIFERTTIDELADRVKDVEVLIVNKFAIGKSEIDLMPHLKYIIVAATGYNNISINDCQTAGIFVSNIRGYSTESVTQHVFALILALTNKVNYYDKEVKNGRWSRSPDFCFYDHSLPNLAGKTIGLIGWGDIAKSVAMVAKAFGMKIIIHSRTMDSDLTEGMTWVGREDLFENADIISLHCSLTEDTKEIINRTSLKLMKPTSFVINTGRGGLVNENDLFYAIDHGLIAGVGLDVMTHEPPHVTNPLMYHAKVVITPHIAWASQAARTKLLNSICDCIRSYELGKVLNQII